MPVQPINTIKNWFKTKLKPTRAQFWDWLDSYYHKNDTIPQSAVEDLDATLQGLVTQAELAQISSGLSGAELLNVSGNDTFDLAGGDLLIRVVYIPSSTGEFKIGTTLNGSELYSDNADSLNAQNIILEFFSSSLQTLHFTGSGVFKIYVNSFAIVTEQTISSTGTFALASGKLLERIMLLPSSTGEFKIGTTLNGSELFSGNLTVNEWENIKPEYYASSAQTIYFTGNAFLKIYTQ